MSLPLHPSRCFLEIQTFQNTPKFKTASESYNLERKVALQPSFFRVFSVFFLKVVFLLSPSRFFAGFLSNPGTHTLHPKFWPIATRPTWNSEGFFQNTTYNSYVVGVIFWAESWPKQWEMGRKIAPFTFRWLYGGCVLPHSGVTVGSFWVELFHLNFPAAQPTVQLSRCQKSLDRRRSGVQATETRGFHFDIDWSYITNVWHTINTQHPSNLKILKQQRIP